MMKMREGDSIRGYQVGEFFPSHHGNGSFT